MESIFQRSDELLCTLAASGDREAEENLVTRYSRLVRMCARPYFLMGGDSEDLIQEGMLGLLSAVRSFSPEKGSGFRTYAETCIRNRICSAVRGASRDKHGPLNHSLPIDSAPLGEGASSTGDPEDMLISREDRKKQLDFFHARLSAFEKTVLGFYLDGLSCREIAQRVGKPLKSVDNAVQRIRRKAAPFLTPGDISES